MLVSCDVTHSYLEDSTLCCSMGMWYTACPLMCIYYMVKRSRLAMQFDSIYLVHKYIYGV